MKARLSVSSLEKRPRLVLGQQLNMNRKARILRKKSIRVRVVGSKEIPRLNVFRSNVHIYAALIDDLDGKTLIMASDKNIKDGEKLTKSRRAYQVGKTIGQEAIKKGFKKVVFDRAGYLYHGRVKNLAEGAREAGLKF